MLSSFKIKIGNVYCPVYILEFLTSVFIDLSYIIKASGCQFVTAKCPITLTSPPLLKLLDSLPYDLAEVIKLIGEHLSPPFFSFKKILYVIPSALLSFFPY